MIYSTICYSQETDQKISSTSKQKKELYKFYIPQILNGSNLDPSPISSANANFTDSKISLKVGFPTVFKKIDETATNKQFDFTGFIQLNFKASNGITTLYKEGNPPLEYGFTGGVSFILKHKYWVLVKDSVVTSERSSEALMWVNLVANIEKSNLSILYPQNSYGSVRTKERGETGSIFISLNRYFFSKLKKYKPLSCIWSLGIGYAETNNFYALKKRSYQSGSLVYNTDSSSFETVTDPISGALGPLTKYKGLASYGELFIPLVRKDNGFGAIYWGTRLSAYNISDKSKLINGNSGFYILFRDNKREKDAAAFSITAQINQINERKKESFYKNNLSIILQAGIPLRFN